MKNKAQQQRGFTLIELLVVLLIVSIITAVAVLAFQNFGRSRRARMAINEFKNVVSLAQQRAILQSIVLGMQFTAHGYRFYQYQEAGDPKKPRWETLPSDTLSQSNAFPSAVSFSLKLNTNTQKDDSPFAKKFVIFLPDGFITPFTVRFQLDDLKQTFEVNTTGQKRMVG